MIRFRTITTFRTRLQNLKGFKRGVYAGIEDEIQREFAGKTIEQIRQNNDMILMEGDLILIKLRLPDKKHRLAKKDGYRMIYLVSKVDDVVVFLDIYPKNGPLQQLNESDEEIKRLLTEFISEAQGEKLIDYNIISPK